MKTYQDRVKVLQSESERLRQYLGGLPADAWTKQSACDLWQIRDVVGHLVGGAEFYAETVARGVQRISSPPEGRQPAGTGSGASSAERIAQGGIANRERHGDQLLPAFEDRDHKLNGLLAGLSAQDREKPCYHPGGIVPAGNFVDLRIKEVALHDWDIRSSLEPNARLSPEAVPSIMLLLARSLASGSFPWAFWPGPKLSEPVRYRFEVAEPVPIRADIAVEGDRARLEDAGDGPADVTFRCNTETYLLLINGRVSPAPAMADGRLTVEGDAGLAAKFGQWFQGI